MKKLKEKMLLLGLNPKKEFLIILFADLGLLIIGIVIFFVFKQLMYSLTTLPLIFIFDLLFLSRYSRKINDINTKNLQEFTILFGYFRIFIRNGYSVYSALKELVGFANLNLKKMLETLILEIDSDKSVQPFINFSKNFNEIIVEEMMVSIYQMIDDGESSNYLNQFELIFDKFSDLLYEKNLRTKNSRLGIISSSALIASSYLMIVLTIGIVSIIGEVINGI